MPFQKHILFLIGLGLLNAFVVSAEMTVNGKGPHCFNLGELTCGREPGHVSTDATGSVVNNSPKPKNLDKTLETAKAEIDKRVPGILRGWRARRVWDEKVRDLGLSNHSECATPQLSRTPPCIQKVSRASAALLLANATRGSFPEDTAMGADARFAALEGARKIQGDPLFKYNLKTVIDKSIKTNADPEQTKNIEKVYDEVFQAMIEVIENKFPPGATRDQMLTKVKSVKFVGTDCPNIETQEKEISSYYQANAYYNNGTKFIRYCRGLADDGSSKYGLSFILGHELGHSLDPCAMPVTEDSWWSYLTNLGPTAYPEDESGQIAVAPTKNLIRCLTDPGAAGAKHIKSKIAKTPYTPKWYCSGTNQIGETVADWFGTEILAIQLKKGNLGPNNPDAVKKGMTNVFPFFCDKYSKRSEVVHRHMNPRDRIDRVIAVHPQLRKAMDCDASSSPSYCDGQAPMQGPPGPITPGLIILPSDEQETRK